MRMVQSVRCADTAKDASWACGNLERQQGDCPVTAPKPNALVLSVCIVLFMLLMTGCTAKPPEVQTRFVEVPSSKPYRYITYTPETPESVAKQIRRHNRSHTAVIEAEKKTKP